MPQKLYAAANRLESFIDCGLLNPLRRRSDGRHPISWLCEETLRLGTPLIPVVSMDSDADYWAAVKDADERLGLDIALRLDVSDLSNLPAIRAMIADFEDAYANVHLIVDCEHLRSQGAELLPMVLPTLVNALTALGAWENVNAP